MSSATVLDKALAHVAPGLAANRLRARQRFEALAGGAGGYTGGGHGRPLFNWNPLGGSADADSLPDLPTLRARSRDLARNAPLAASAIKTVTTNVVGPGLVLQSQLDADVLGLDPGDAERLQDRIEAEWRLFSETVECDASRRSNFRALQGLVLRGALESGDIFALRRNFARAGSPYRIRVQLLEADRCSNPGRALDGPRLAGGVEKVPETGEPVAYHFSNRHPGERFFLGPSHWVRVPAFGPTTGAPLVLHCYQRLRYDQTRGVPILAPVMQALKQLDRYTDAEVWAAVLNAFFAIVTKTQGAEGLPPATGDGAVTSAAERQPLSVEAGSIIDLDLNEDVVGFTPGRPNANFDQFVLSILRQIGAALGIPLEVLIKHFTSSYSAARAALLEAWKAYREYRAWLVDGFCNPVYAWFFAEAAASGRIEAPGFFTDPARRAAWLGARWVGPGPGQIQPKQETEAAVARVESGLSTLQEETAAISGGDWQRNHEQRREEARRRREDGLAPPPGAQSAPMIAAPEDDPDAADENERRPAR